MSQPAGPAVKQPTHRPLKIYATDPLLDSRNTVGFGNRSRIEIDNETLQPGPSGARVQVIDYDGARNCFYPPVNLDDPAILMNGGLEPSESDPRFHQQMVYGVAMRTLGNFDRALGRSLLWRTKKGERQKLRLFPHAFYGANAYYDPDLHAILFGCFKADDENAGLNLPGQWVFTCLSHDIIAHEMTHAVLHRLRPFFLEPSNQDVLAFHEGFSDLVAMLQHFSFRDVLLDQINRTRGNLREAPLLTQIGRQFGTALGEGDYLRSAIDNPAHHRMQTEHEPHLRGTILLSAVFDAFFSVFERRTSDLIRLATHGARQLPDSEMNPDLLNRMVDEAARLAQSLLDRCIRAFDYLPPVDITFGDYLRALVTADYEISPEDEQGLRAALIEGFRRRGVYPEGVASFAEESLLWERWDPIRAINYKGALAVDLMNMKSLIVNIVQASSFERDRALTHHNSFEEQRYDEEVKQFSEGSEDNETMNQVGGAPNGEIFVYLRNFARQQATELMLDPNPQIQVLSFNSVLRILPNGRPRLEHVVQFGQQIKGSETRFGGIPFRGGTTVILSAIGEIRYVIAKPLPEARGLTATKRQLAKERENNQLHFLNELDSHDPRTPYYSSTDQAKRMKLRMKLAPLHEGHRL